MVSDADHLALSRLVVEIAWRIDHGQADTIWELFVPDGVLSSGGTPLLDALQATLLPEPAPWLAATG